MVSAGRQRDGETHVHTCILSQILSPEMITEYWVKFSVLDSRSLSASPRPQCARASPRPPPPAPSIIISFSKSICESVSILQIRSFVCFSLDSTYK